MRARFAGRPSCRACRVHERAVQHRCRFRPAAARRRSAIGAAAGADARDAPPPRHPAGARSARCAGDAAPRAASTGGLAVRRGHDRPAARPRAASIPRSRCRRCRRSRRGPTRSRRGRDGRRRRPGGRARRRTGGRAARSSPRATASRRRPTSGAAATRAGRTRGYDCSGSVSYALHGAGLLDAPLVSGELQALGPGRRRALGDDLRQPHATCTWSSPGCASTPPASASAGTRWQAATRPSRGFRVRHPAGL